MSIFFYYVRHGQTLFNRMKRMQGCCDSPLTEQGLKDARRAELALRQVPFTHAFTSSSERAVDTAEIILERHNVEALRMKGLKEFDFGELDGARLTDLQAKEEIDRRMQNGYTFEDIGGDSTDTIRTRISKTFEMIVKMCRDKERVLIVSHGCYGLHVMNELFGMDIQVFRRERQDVKTFPFPNGGIMQFAYGDGKWTMLQMPTEPEHFRDLAK